MRGKVKKLRRLEECCIAQAQREETEKRQFADRILMERGFKKNKKEIIVWIHEQDISVFKKINKLNCITISNYSSSIFFTEIIHYTSDKGVVQKWVNEKSMSTCAFIKSKRLHSWSVCSYTRFQRKARRMNQIDGVVKKNDNKRLQEPTRAQAGHRNTD